MNEAATRAELVDAPAQARTKAKIEVSSRDISH
jgi:hypothetical protein